MTDVKYYPIELLHWAGMKDEHIDELIDILNAHPEYIYETNDFGDNCLFIASRSGNLEMVKYIINNTKIDINCTNSDGNALLVAVSERKWEVVNYFLDETTIDKYAKNKRGEGIYHLAARAGNADLIEKLLEIDPEKRITDLDFLKRNCLFQLMENYGFHKDYWCFELIFQALPDEPLWTRDIEGLNIIDYAKEKQYVKTEHGILDASKIYAPLINVLKSRTLFGKLNESLPGKEDSQDKGRIKV
jgi:ankyrin repeat protein